ncbi:MAG: 2-oxoglutarate dehydrogenase E1 subunit family protein, partial [Byssovorax sp.]
MALDFGINTGFVEELYAQYLENPESVDPSWRSYFDGRLGSTHGGSELLRRAPGLPLTNGHLARSLDLAFNAHAAASPLPAPSPLDHERELLAQAAIHGRVYKLLNAYRVRGHLFAHIDPLGVPPEAPPELELSNFELSPEDLDKPFPTIDLAGAGPVQTLREIIQHLEETYCRSVGVEYMHIDNPEQRAWIQQRMEATKNRLTLGHQEQLRILTKLSDAEIFEQFIQRSYGAGTKRFSLEGAESLIPLLDLLIERAGSEGVTEIVFGMAHRGRLNVLANIMDKSLREIFAAFEDKDAKRYLGGGDVKYHLGYSTDRSVESGQSVHLTLSFNPSHLEFVNPVVEGRVRAKQDRIGDQAEARRRVMPLL